MAPGVAAVAVRGRAVPSFWTAMPVLLPRVSWLGARPLSSTCQPANPRTALRSIRSPAEVSTNQVVRYLEGITGRTVNVIYEVTQKGDVRHTVADTAKTKALLDYEPQRPFGDALREHVQSARAFCGL